MIFACIVFRVFIDWPDSNWCCQAVCREWIRKHTANTQWCGLLQQNYCRIRGSLHLLWWLSPGWCSKKGVPKWWGMEWQYTSVLHRPRNTRWYIIVCDLQSRGKPSYTSTLLLRKFHSMAHNKIIRCVYEFSLWPSWYWTMGWVWVSHWNSTVRGSYSKHSSICVSRVATMAKMLYTRVKLYSQTMNLSGESSLIAGHASPYQ